MGSLFCTWQACTIFPEIFSHETLPVKVLPFDRDHLQWALSSLIPDIVVVVVVVVVGHRRTKYCLPSCGLLRAKLCRPRICPKVDDCLLLPLKLPTNSSFGTPQRAEMFHLFTTSQCHSLWVLCKFKKRFCEWWSNATDRSFLFSAFHVSECDTY